LEFKSKGLNFKNGGKRSRQEGVKELK
jgi:hypothetical protein